MKHTEIILVFFSALALVGCKGKNNSETEEAPEVENQPVMTENIERKSEGEIYAELLEKPSLEEMQQRPEDQLDNSKLKYKNVGVQEFKRLTEQDNAQLLDCRTDTEYAIAHIHGATLIDVKSDDFKAKALKTLDRERPVAVYCKSGRRSRVAADILAKEGYKVFNLDAGLASWSEAGEDLDRQ